MRIDGEQRVRLRFRLLWIAAEMVGVGARIMGWNALVGLGIFERRLLGSDITQELRLDPLETRLELQGQILLEGGKPAEAIAPLREATQESGDMPLIAGMLGHALVATENPKNFIEAKQVLKAAVNRDNQNPFAWYQLGIIYDREGDESRAALATAERSNLENEPKMALASAQMALKGIPPGTPDYLRAQDIAMVSRAELAKKDKKYRDKDESKQ